VKTRTVNGETKYLFEDVNEFREYHPSVTICSDWRHASVDDWIVSDDGQVCQVLYVGILKNPNRKKETTFVRTIIGSFVCGPNVTMEGEMRTNMHTFAKDGKSPSVRKKERTKATEKEFLFAKYVAKGDDVVEAYMSAFPSKKKSYAESQAKLLLKTDRVKNLIREEIDKVLNEAEITPLYLLEEMRSIIDKKGSTDRDKLSALNTLMKISGMMDTEKKSESITLFQGFTKEQLNAIQGPEVKKLQEVKIDSKKE
jgi:hypothetical protein